ncbi:Spc98 family-domain-containing protein [Naematelia encephala]|uniref:Spindle pole body component n=1 Tax=Naematelia encephala TaxID=71784 RepID=A0A1Y2BJD4_9TREE|nr:Spc98 family-domain-containing protein [Naematelia encephala]
MLAELLLVLAGHPSSFFIPSPASSPITLALSPKLSTYLHPGEIASLDVLGQLAFRYSHVRSWALDIQRRGRDSVLTTALARGKGKGKEVDHGDIYLSTLAGALLDVLKEYEILVLSTEAKVLALDPVLVQDQQGYVPLSALVATFSTWQAPLASLTELILSLDSSPPTPGMLIHVLQQRVQTGNPTLATVYIQLLSTLTGLFLTHLAAFLLYGLTPSLGLDIGPDPLSPSHRVYRLDERLVPPSIRKGTQESILYVGRVAATLRREGRELPVGLVNDLRQEIMRVRSLEEGDLDNAVQRARQEVGEWLWKHILTGPQVVEALETFGNYFLTRSSDYSLALIRELHKLHLDKLITSNPHSSSSAIREQDLHLALLRASVGTSVENDKALDSLRLHLPQGTLRPLLPSVSARPHVSSSSGDNPIRDLFSSTLLGAPMELVTTISWPLDLFLTPPTLAAYTDIHAYLFALRDTHARVLDTWSRLSQSQRRRLKWTNTAERDYRAAWGSVRIMLFFLDELLSHFLLDVIDVQHRRLLEELQGAGAPSRGGTGGTPKGSLTSSIQQGSVTTTRQGGGGGITPAPSIFNGHRAGSPAPSEETHGGFDTATVRSQAPPVPDKAAHNYLDFLALRQMHARHLAFLREGLLIADRSMAVLLRDIFNTCRRFAGLIERWGGTVMPELLEEDDQGKMVEDRTFAIKETSELKQRLQRFTDLLSEFFKALLDTQNPPPAGTGTGTGADISSASAAGISFSRTARMAQMSRQTSFTAAGARRSKDDGKSAVEAEVSMGKHIEQLLLRLDFNGVLTDWQTREEELGISRNVLAEGGL